LFWANKVAKNKPQSWKRTYFTIDPGSLTQVIFEDGNVRSCLMLPFPQFDDVRFI